jgi:hypothetical protein
MYEATLTGWHVMNPGLKGSARCQTSKRWNFGGAVGQGFAVGGVR